MTIRFKEVNNPNFPEDQFVWSGNIDPESEDFVDRIRKMVKKICVLFGGIDGYIVEIQKIDSNNRLVFL